TKANRDSIPPADAPIPTTGVDRTFSVGGSSSWLLFFGPFIPQRFPFTPVIPRCRTDYPMSCQAAHHFSLLFLFPGARGELLGKGAVLQSAFVLRHTTH